MGLLDLAAGPEGGGKNGPGRTAEVRDGFPPALKLLNDDAGTAGRAPEVPGGGGGGARGGGGGAPGAKKPPTVGGGPGGGGGGNGPFFFPIDSGLRSFSFPRSPPAARRAGDRRCSMIKWKIHQIEKHYDFI